MLNRPKSNADTDEMEVQHISGKSHPMDVNGNDSQVVDNGARCLNNNNNDSHKNNTAKTSNPYSDTTILHVEGAEIHELQRQPLLDEKGGVENRGKANRNRGNAHKAVKFDDELGADDNNHNSCPKRSKDTQAEDVV